MLTHQPGMLSLTITDKTVLHAAYMPFIKGGGLFVPTSKSYQLGEEVSMQLHLMEEPEHVPVVGKIVWIAPRGIKGNQPPGVGIQLSEESAPAKKKIEGYLAGFLGSGG